MFTMKKIDLKSYKGTSFFQELPRLEAKQVRSKGSPASNTESSITALCYPPHCIGDSWIV